MTLETKTAPPPPTHLSPGSRELWEKLVPARCESPERVELLAAALMARDRAEAAREALERDGMTSESKTGLVHVHPLVRVEKDALALFARIWSSLGLDRRPSIDGYAWQDEEEDED